MDEKLIDFILNEQYSKSKEEIKKIISSKINEILKDKNFKKIKIN